MITRRTFAKAVGVAGAVPLGGPALAEAHPFRGLGPLHHVRTDVLDIAYYEAGPANGEVVLLEHGFPYSPFAFVDVVPDLVRHGYRVLVPYVRGHGPTTFLDKNTMRSGQQAALGSDVIGFMDALDVRSAIFAGYDWGGRGLCVAAALWPERCKGLVSVNSYLIQNLAKVDVPLVPSIESATWYFWYLLTERGKAGLAANTKEFARVLWTRNSPDWRFTEADLDRAAELFKNPDYVDVAVHSYRHRLNAAPGDRRYDALEAKLLRQPVITVPAVTLDGVADGNFPATDGKSSAHFFTGPRVHHQVRGAGHNLPQERPKAFISAIVEVAHLR